MLYYAVAMDERVRANWNRRVLELRRLQCGLVWVYIPSMFANIWY